MFTRNYINYCTPPMNISSNGSFYVKDVTGSINKCAMNTVAVSSSISNYNDTATNQPQSTISSLGLVLGSGTTAPTIEDYRLESIISTLTDAGHNLTHPTDYSNEAYVTLTQTVVNDTENPITVSEIGIVSNPSSVPSSTVNSTLFSRDVITPVTIGVGENKTFVVTVDFTQMSTSASAN